MIGDPEKDLLSAKAVMLGLDKDDQIVSAQTYNCIALSDRKVLGWADIAQLRFEP